MVDAEKGNVKEVGEKNPFGWYQAIVTLAGQDVLKIPQVVQINHIEAFNFMTYMIDQNNKQEQEFRKYANI